MSRKKLFEDALKKAKEGDLFNYDIWLKENGIYPHLLTINHFLNHFSSYPDEMIGNDEKIILIGEYLGLFLKELTGLYHFPIIGAKGLGKTLFSSIIKKFTDRHGRSKKIDIIGMENILSHDIDQKDFPPRPQANTKIIDNCEKVKEIKKILENILKLESEGVYITIWTPESWIYYRDEIDEVLPVTKELFLNPIQEKEEILLFLKTAITSLLIPEKVKNSDSVAIPDFIDYNNMNLLSEIYFKYSQGNPWLILKLMFKSFEDVYRKKQDYLTQEAIVNSAKILGLYKLEENLKELSAQHLIFLKRILLDNYTEGTRPVQLVKEFNLDKSTIAYHLNKLTDTDTDTNKFLTVKRIGKSSFYKIKENLIPFIQMKILEEKKSNE